MIKSSMHLARRGAVQALYQWTMTAQPGAEIQNTFIHNPALSGRHKDYFTALLQAIPPAIDTIDALLKPHLDRSLDKVDPVEQAILRLATYELRYQANLPLRVILDEAVLLAKAFCAENGYRYVNGVLDKVAQQVRAPGATETAAPAAAPEAEH